MITFAILFAIVALSSFAVLAVLFFALDVMRGGFYGRGRVLTLRASLLGVVVLACSVGSTALAAGLMHPPANKGYAYQSSSKPACSSTSHLYTGWIWAETPDGDSDYSRVLVCTSSQGSEAGYGWRALAIDTASVQ